MHALKFIFKKTKGVVALSCAMCLIVLSAAAGLLFYKKVASDNPSPPIVVKAEATPAPVSKQFTALFPKTDKIRIIFLHHSTGELVWKAGVPQLMDQYNVEHGKAYSVSEMNYPNAKNGYPWDNYPYDYCNFWIKQRGNQQDKKELNLDQLAADYDVISFKHCFPVGEIQKDTGKPDINSKEKSLENYKLQYNALKKRMQEFPNKRFLVWTGAVLGEKNTTKEQAQRAKEWANWVRTEWNTPGDNIFVFDFEKLETEGGLYLKYSVAETNSHPSSTFAKTAAEAFAKRLIEVIEKAE